MTRKQRRLSFFVLILTTLSLATALVLMALEDKIIFFYSPSDISEENLPPDRLFRIGGLVKKNSIKQDIDGITTLFSLTDLLKTVDVKYRGILPDLFREGQGIVAKGKLNKEGVFFAEEILAKHDEKYMPPEVADSLRKTGLWKGPQTK